MRGSGSGSMISAKIKSFMTLKFSVCYPRCESGRWYVSRLVRCTRLQIPFFFLPTSRLDRSMYDRACSPRTSHFLVC